MRSAHKIGLLIGAALMLLLPKHGYAGQLRRAGDRNVNYAALPTDRVMARAAASCSIQRPSHDQPMTMTSTETPRA